MRARSCASPAEWQRAARPRRLDVGLDRPPPARRRPRTRSARRRRRCGQQGGRGDEGGVVLDRHHAPHDAHQAGVLRRRPARGAAAPRCCSARANGARSKPSGIDVEVIARRPPGTRPPARPPAAARAPPAGWWPGPAAARAAGTTGSWPGRSSRAARGRGRCARAPAPRTARPPPGRWPRPWPCGCAPPAGRSRSITRSSCQVVFRSRSGRISRPRRGDGHHLLDARPPPAGRPCRPRWPRSSRSPAPSGSGCGRGPGW